MVAQLCTRQRTPKRCLFTIQSQSQSQSQSIITITSITINRQVSHDQYLIESTVDELWMCEGRTITPFHGTFEEYKARLRRMRVGATGAGGVAAGAGAGAPAGGGGGSGGGGGDAK